MRVRTEGDGWIVLARKTVRETDPYMPGHFPGLILYPAVFLLETVRQSVGMATAETWGGWLEIDSIRQLRIARPMLAHDELDVHITVTPSTTTLHATVRCECAGNLVAELAMELVRGDNDGT